MSHGEFRFLVLVPALGLAGCTAHVGGPERASAVDVEQVALDVEACAKALPTCQRSGPVSGVASLVDDPTKAVRLEPGGSIEGALLRPEARLRLESIVVGVRAIGNDGVPRELDVTVSGMRAGVVPIKTSNGFFHVFEVAELGDVPPPDARIRIVAAQGTFDILYVIGRWNEPLRGAGG